MDKIIGRPRNASFNQTDSSEGSSTQLVQTVQLLFYSLIAIVGMTGNVAICILIITRKKRKISEYFILNLAVADLTTCVVSIPLDMIEQLSESWPYGSFLCKLVYPTQTVLMAVSVATLVAMSLERHRAIMHPLKPRMNRTLTKAVIAVIWIGSVLLVSPYIHVLSYQNSQCVEQWPGDGTNYARAFTVSVFVVLYALPLLGISVAYARVCTRLYKDSNSEESVLRCNANDSSEERRRRAKRNTRIIRVFAAAVIAFAVCMLPNHLIWLCKDFETEVDSPLFDHPLVFAQILVYANSSINPFVFGTLHIRYTCCKRLFRSSRDCKEPKTSSRQLTMPASFSSVSKKRSKTKQVRKIGGQSV